MFPDLIAKPRGHGGNRTEIIERQHELAIIFLTHPLAYLYLERQHVSRDLQRDYAQHHGYGHVYVLSRACGLCEGAAIEI